MPNELLPNDKLTETVKTKTYTQILLKYLQPSAMKFQKSKNGDIYANRLVWLVGEVDRVINHWL